MTLFLVYTVRHVRWRVSSDCDVMHYDVIWILLCHATVHDTVVAGKVLHNSLVYNVICHCQGAYGAERLWEGSLNKTENCTIIKRAFVRKAGKLSGSVTKVPVYYIQSVAYEVVVISLKVVISLIVPFSILRCVPANSMFEIGIIKWLLCMCLQFIFAFVP